MSKYSFSKVQTYQQCPLKFRYKYIDNIQLKDFEETADLLLGKSVHASLEKLYNDINNFKIPTQIQLLDYFKIYRDSAINDLKSKGQELIIKGKSQVEDYIRRGEEYLKAYYDKNKENFQDTKIVGTELMLLFDIDEGIKFTGFIDRLDKVGQDFIINDYKTNKNLPAEDKEEYIEQLTLYGLGIKQKYGKYLHKIKARLHFLHFDIQDEWEIDDEILNRVVTKYKTIIQEIEKKKSALENDTKAFKPCENSYCNYCEYMSICPLFSHIKMEDESIDGISEKTVKNLVDEYANLSKEYNRIDKEKENLKDLFLTYVKGKDITRLYGNQSTISISEMKNYKILNKDDFMTKIREMGLLQDVLDIDRFKVNRLIKDGKIDKQLIKDLVEESIGYVFKSKIIEE